MLLQGTLPERTFNKSTITTFFCSFYFYNNKILKQEINQENKQIPEENVYITIIKIRKK